jgi:hypothetical protein
MEGMPLQLGQDETLNFFVGGEHRVTVRVLQVVDEHNAARRKLICEGVSQQDVEQLTQEAFERFAEGTPLGARPRAFFDQVLSDIADHMTRLVIVLRWRRSIMDGPLSPFSNGTESFSLDGVEWREEPRRAVSLRMSFGHPYPSGEITQGLCDEITALANGGADEPFERQLFREAWNLRNGYPKAALVIGVAAAEIGFRKLVRPHQGHKGILRLLGKYWPHPPPIPHVGSREIKPSQAILDSLKDGIRKRDAVVHEGAPAPSQDELRNILWNISQLLWIWDFYAGHGWALEHLAASSVAS